MGNTTLTQHQVYVDSEGRRYVIVEPKDVETRGLLVKPDESVAKKVIYLS